MIEFIAQGRAAALNQLSIEKLEPEERDELKKRIAMLPKGADECYVHVVQSRTGFDVYLSNRFHKD